ncbi:MAG TPA: lipopolysaccharide kinase InaA family protein [Planctomycetota bacterium]
MGWSHHAAPGRELPPLERGFPAGAVLAVLVERPTVTVQRVAAAGGDLVVKRYFFPRLGQRVRALHRHTWLGLAKPAREARNLLRLGAAGAPALEPVAWGVLTRGVGIVHDGWLALPWLEGARTLEQALLAGETLPADWWDRLGAALGKVHAAGCWYRNLAARNVLLDEPADATAPSPRGHLIDPAKSAWLPAPLEPGRAAADLLLFGAPLAAALPPGAWAALLAAHGAFAAEDDPRALEAQIPRELHRRIEPWLRRECARFGAAAG